ncbi:Hpt domain-containing protein [Aestuariivirga sp.]|uniref:Hpt domain-containing protein n=1 Tax=Aestuariivirga sp. TaxID=2650926 RepID=UPI0039E46A55
MATRDRGSRKAASAGDAEVLNRAHLAHYTLDNAELEREIVALFLEQLPVTIAAMENAKTATDWKMAAHTVKGSAAAVGATRINAIADELEAHAANRRSSTAQALMMDMQEAAEQFRAVAKRIFG